MKYRCSACQVVFVYEPLYSRRGYAYCCEECLSDSTFVDDMEEGMFGLGVPQDENCDCEGFCTGNCKES